MLATGYWRPDGRRRLKPPNSTTWATIADDRSSSWSSPVTSNDPRTMYVSGHKPRQTRRIVLQTQILPGQSLEQPFQQHRRTATWSRRVQHLGTTGTTMPPKRCDDAMGRWRPSCYFNELENQKNCVFYHLNYIPSDARFCIDGVYFRAVCFVLVLLSGKRFVVSVKWPGTTSQRSTWIRNNKRAASSLLCLATLAALQPAKSRLLVVVVEWMVVGCLSRQSAAGAIIISPPGQLIIDGENADNYCRLILLLAILHFDGKR